MNFRSSLAPIALATAPPGGADPWLGAGPTPISELEGAVDPRHLPGDRGAAKFPVPAGRLRSVQALGARPGCPAHAGIPEGPGREHGRPGRRRARQLSDLALPAERHAAHADIRIAGIRHHAGSDLPDLGADHLRRIFTDGRAWPKKPVPTYGGYTIGKWIDQDGDGVYDMLKTETRYFKGPRAYDASGLPLHDDNQSIFKEQFFVDGNGDHHDLTTVIDNALTRPWTADRPYRRVSEKVVQWPETCARKATPTSSSARKTISCARTAS